MVDTIFADVAQPDQARIVAINAHHFLRNEGHVVISIKVCLCVVHNCIYLSSSSSLAMLMLLGHVNIFDSC